MEINDYGNGIITITDCLDIETCDSIIQLFESQEVQSHLKNNETAYYDKGTQYLETLYATQDSPQLTKLVYGLVKQLLPVYADITGYEGVLNISGFIPPVVKKYRNNGEDEFASHYDVDGEVLTRTLAIIWYLNDVEGGETEFTDKNISITPQAGTCLLFPPFWTHIHRAKKPINTHKYTLNLFAHL